MPVFDQNLFHVTTIEISIDKQQHVDYRTNNFLSLVFGSGARESKSFIVIRELVSPPPQCIFPSFFFSSKMYGTHFLNIGNSQFLILVYNLYLFLCITTKMHFKFNSSSMLNRLSLILFKQQRQERFPRIHFIIAFSKREICVCVCSKDSRYK